MLPFAVRVAGLDEPDGQTCRWVMAIDGERFLIVNGEGAFEWRPMSDCTFVKAQSPDMPQLVMPVQPQGAPSVMVPSRQIRRELERNGHN